MVQYMRMIVVLLHNFLKFMNFPCPINGLWVWSRTTPICFFFISIYATKRKSRQKEITNGSNVRVNTSGTSNKQGTSKPLILIWDISIGILRTYWWWQMVMCSFQRRHLATHLSNNNVSRESSGKRKSVWSSTRRTIYEASGYPLLALEATIESREELNSSYGGRKREFIDGFNKFCPWPLPPSPSTRENRNNPRRSLLDIDDVIAMCSLCLVLLFFVSGTPVNTKRRE